MASLAVTYSFRQPAPNLVVQPMIAPLTYTAQVSTASLDFGLIAVGVESSGSVLLTNTGTGELTLSPPVTSGAAFSGATNCSAALTVGGSCLTNVTFAPFAVGPFAGTLTLSSDAAGAPFNVALRGTGGMAVGALTANTSASFGTVLVNSTTTRSFTFRNTGNLPATGVYAAVAGVTGLSISANTCGTAGAPVSLAGGADCAITLTYTPSIASGLGSSALSVFAGFSANPFTTALSGSAGGFDAAANWSETHASTVPLTGATASFGTQTSVSSNPGTNTSNTYYLRNTGAVGALTATFQLVGDTQHFQLTSLQKHQNAAAADGCGAGITNGGATSTTCTADNPASGSGYNHMRVSVRYAPLSSGVHSVQLVPALGNGATPPATLTLTGTGAFNPAGVWSSEFASTVALSGADTGFATQTGVATGGTTQTRTYYLRNTGTHGSMVSSFALSGDTSHFRITSVQRHQNANAASPCSAAIVSGGLSTTACTADDPKVQSGFNHMAITVEYAPKAAGNHAVQLTPTSNNGSTLPAAVTLTGTGAFNPVGAWSSDYPSTVALSGTDTNFGTRTSVATGPSTSRTRTFYLRNTGQFGAMASTFVLSGDTAHFRISSVEKHQNANSFIPCGASLVSGALSSTTCTADDPKGGGGYNHMAVTVRYVPQTVGNHSVQMTPVASNSSTMPAAVTFTGVGN